MMKRAILRQWFLPCREKEQMSLQTKYWLVAAHYGELMAHAVETIVINTKTGLHC